MPFLVRPLDSLLHFGIQLINNIIGFEIGRKYLQVQTSKISTVSHLGKQWRNQNRIKIPAFNKNIRVMTTP